MSMIGPVQSRCHEGSPAGKRNLRWEGFVEKVNNTFSVEYWSNLKIRVWGRSRSLDHNLLYWSAIIKYLIYLYLVQFLTYLTLNNIVTLKSRLGVTQASVDRCSTI